MRKHPRLAPGVLVLAAFAAFLPGRAAEPAKPALDPNLPYQAKRSNPVTYDVDFSVVVTPPYHTKILKVWLPLPQSDAGQEVTEGELSSFPMEVTPRLASEKVYGNKFAYFEFDHPKGAQIVRHKFKVKVWELRWDVDPAKVLAVAKWPVTFEPYLRSDRSVVVNDRFKKVAAKIVPRKHGAACDLAEVFAWVQDNMKYDHVHASLQASAEHALKEGRGHCSDYHGLCAALGRSLGYPTRITYGINPFPKNSPSHCKLEVFLPPYGWVSYDVSETQQLLASIKNDEQLDAKQRDRLLKAAKERFLRGFRDNTWFLQTRGTDYELAPPARKRAAVMRTAYVEADGVALSEPDPANPDKREFSWMTVHKFTPDRKVPYPFKDRSGLLPNAEGPQKARPGVTRERSGTWRPYQPDPPQTPATKRQRQARG
jgi:transglutaminase-like putative cysteine protease